MLDSIFMQILDMGKTASIVILVVLLARLLLKKAPKVFSYALWAVVLFRLLCPVTFEAAVSIVPEMASVSQDYSLSETPISVLGAAEAAYHAVGDALNGGLGVQDIRTTEKDVTGRTKYVGSLWWEVWILFGQYVWIAGMGAMLLYSAVSYLKIRKKLLVVVPLRDNIFLADDIKSPFVVGLFRPKIYLPCNLEEKEQEYIILHEQYHIKRLDHIIKALAFLTLSIHWFNPLAWVAFIYSNKDMEMSCDEAVVKKMGDDVRADYSASLLTLATGRRIIAGTPLAFGEGDTKSRIRNLANWRKPAFWVVLISVVACIALAVGLLTNPAKDDSWIKATHGATSVELECNLTPPIRSYAIYEDIYENGELISSEAIIFDRFQEEGGATPRRTTLSLNAQPVNGEEGGFSGKLSLYFEGVGSAHLTRKLPKTHYTGAVHVAAEIGNGIFSKQKVATEDNVTLLTILLSTDPEGKVVVKTQNNTLVQSNDTVVIYRLVTSVGGDAATHLFYGANAIQSNTPGTIKAPSIPVTWTYSPMMSSTWHVAFRFEFNFDYTHIKASCDQGELWNLHGEEQSRNTHMQFESTNPICWTPSMNNSLAEKANVDFTVYDDETQLYTGRIEITKTGEEGGRTSYEAKLVNCPNLYILPVDGSVGSVSGAKIITAHTYEAMTSQDTVIWSDADLDHDGTNETIHVREMYDGMVYELSVVNQDGTILWSTEAAQAHMGWNSILLYEEGGKDYLLRYTPVMYQGVGNYTWTQFFFEGGYPKEVASMNVDFELPTEINSKMREFAEKTNAILKDSMVLLTTEQGMAVIGPKPTIEAPQIYAVYFDPNDIVWDIASNTPEVLDVPENNNTSEQNAETSHTMLGPYLFDLPLYGHMNAEEGFSKHYAAGTEVRISGEWRGDYPLSFVFSGEHTDEDVIAVVYSGSSKTITLPTDDDWTCSVSSNGGRTDGDFWLYVTE